ncbi:hypothetical protein EAU56_19120 [Salmonella enterica]|nr:hypothetical protein [Salmonella enterica subsp. enterica serovar Vitkin]EAP3546857.1 hypothetical protein [Salmonella enterica]EBH8265923.1 hypothetical protein [Salmonella enterica subsp. enterica serovar Bareilly]EBQ9477820.1 hypothetical protein [Salmonella enterica subsp. enterica serovar Kokomlemle]EBJ7124410.1 hypothetical protein [Salmonella enterica]
MFLLRTGSLALFGAENMNFNSINIITIHSKELNQILIEYQSKYMFKALEHTDGKDSVRMET